MELKDINNVSIKVGDRVQIVGQQEHYKTVGMYGTVKIIRGSVAVEHDNAFRGGHDCSCSCQQDRGLWYSSPSRQLQVILDDFEGDILHGAVDNFLEP